MEDNSHAQKYLFTEQDLRLTRMSHTFASSCIWRKKGMDKWIATFDLVIRDFEKRNVMFACGLEEMLSYIKNLHFSDEDINYLVEKQLVTKDAVDFFKNLKFTGTVYALAEGTPFFPGEPIVRVTAPLAQAALVEVGLMDIASSNIPFLTKAIRGTIAAKGKLTISTGPLRSHSFESGFKACRAAYLTGWSAWVVPAFPKKYHLNVPTFIVNGQHFFIKSFPSEIEAMEALAESFPDNCSFMVDTYDIANGIEHAIKVAKRMQKEGHQLKSIMIDSGDLVYWCDYARKELDKNGLNYVQILAGTNMDEYKIADVIKKDIKCDVLAMVTEYVTLSDSPKIEAVYKAAQLDIGDRVEHTAKLTPGKLSLPGKKQIFRHYTSDEKLEKDIIGLEDENLGEPILQKVMENGEIIRRNPTLDEIRDFTKAQIERLPEKLLDLEEEHKYPVEISDKIQKIIEDLKKRHIKT